MLRGIWKQLTVLTLCICLFCMGTVACLAEDMTEDELAIATHVVENFLKLAAVPRPSQKEEKISQFFMDWAREQGFEPVQDDVLNVVFDVPATEGYEDYPMVGLQAHMDMVCVGDSEEYDPENDPIKVIVDYDAATMTANGTSLGADDGIERCIDTTLVIDTIKRLSETLPLAIVSNCQAGYIELFMKKTHLTEREITDRLCFGDSGRGKAENIRTIVERHGYTSAYYVGDTEGDRIAVREAGTGFIYASYGFGEASEADITIDSFTELADICGCK